MSEVGTSRNSEILQTITSKSLSPKEKVNALVKAAEGDETVRDFIIDTFWCLAGLDAPYYDDSNGQEYTYRSLLNDFLARGDVSDHLVMTRLDLEMLQKHTEKYATIDPALIRKKIIRENTNQVYRQRKFNLFREESEGFAKLIRCLLSDDIHTKMGDAWIKSLIGVFELDPTRVADAKLGALFFRVDRGEEEVKLLPAIESLKGLRHMQHLVGMSFMSLADSPSFYRMIVLLLKYNVVELEDLMPHVIDRESDATKVIIEKTKDYYTSLVQSLKKFGPSSQVLTCIDDQDADCKHPAMMLLGSLLDEGQWPAAQKIILHLYSYDIDPLVCDVGVLRKVRAYILEYVTKAYDCVCKSPINISSNTARESTSCTHESKDAEMAHVFNAEVFFSELLEMYGLVQHSRIFESQDELLFRIVSIVKCFSSSSPALSCRAGIFKMILNCIIVLGRPNVQLSSIIWEVLNSSLHWKERYSLYKEAWDVGMIRSLQSKILEEFGTVSKVINTGKTPSSKPLSVIQGLITTSYKASHYLKRTSADNIQTMAPALAKNAGLLSPLSTMKVLITIVGNYENMGELVISGMQNWGPLGRDVVGYEMRNFLKMNKVAGSQVGFQVFASTFYRDFCDVEVEGILEFLYEDFGQGNVTNLELLRELLTVAGGMVASWATQATTRLYARGGGNLLQNNVSSFGQNLKISTANKNAESILRSKLMPYGIGMAVRLVHLRDTVIFDESKNQLALYDSISSLIFLLLEFLQKDTDEWRKCFDSISLMADFKLPKEISFAFLRPIADINPKLYPECKDIEKVFYLHSLSDIFCPEGMYKEEIASSSTSYETKSLEKEFEDRKEHVKAVRLEIRQKMSSISRIDIHDFLGNHVLQRALLTSSDALYCSKFLQMLIEFTDLNGIEIYDILFSFMRGLLFSITEDEGNDLGLFLFDSWSIISGWRFSGEPSNIDESKYQKWHSELACSCVFALLSSEELICRVALKVLIRIVSVFPTNGHTGEAILKKIEPIQKEDGNNKALANSYYGQLLKARNDGVWKEGNLKSIEERVKEEKAKQEERLEKLRQQDEALAKEVANYDRQFGENDRDRTSRRDGRDRRSNNVEARAKFVPPEEKLSTKKTDDLDERWQRRGPTGDKRSFTPPVSLGEDSTRNKRPRGSSSDRGYRDRERRSFR